MADTENLADLVITFATIDAPATEGMARMAAAGEEMTGAVTAAAAEVNEALASMAEGAQAAATGMTTAMTEAAAPLERLGAEAQQTAAEVAEANARMKAVEAEWAASAEGTAAKVAEANAKQAASFNALADKVAADNAKMKAAEAEAATANELVSAKMAGTAAGMGALSKASATGSASYSNFAGKLGMTGKQLTILGAAAAVVAVGTTKMAGDFQSVTQKLVSSAGEMESNLDMVRKGILKLSSQTGYSADEMANAMYKIESGGQHGASGLKVLQAAAEGARAEQADMTTVADAVTSALTDYHLTADSAATVTSKLVAATASGKMTFEELSRSLASVLPVASANHVSLNDILGDMASMTTHGMTAQRTTQNLADAIRHMAAPTATQAKEFALLGTNVEQVQANLGTKGLSGTIEDLTNRIQQRMGPQARAVILKLGDALSGLDPKVQELGKQLMAGTINAQDYAMQAKGLPPILQGQASQFATLAKSTHSIGHEQMTGAQVMQTYSGAVRAAMGDATGMNVALMLTGENTKTTTNAIKAVSGATTEAGNHVKGWAGIQQTFNQKMAEAHQSFHNLGIEVGTIFLPVATKALSFFSTGAKFIADHKAAAIALAIVVGGILTVAFAAAAVAAWSFAAALLANPITWIIVAIVAVVAAIIALVVVIVKHWGAIKGFFEKLWRDVVDAFKAAGHGLKVAWDATISWLKGIGSAIAKPFVAAWDAVKRVFEMSPSQIGQAIGYALGRAIKAVGQFFVMMWRSAVEGFHKTVSAAVQFGHDFMAGLKIVWDWLMDTPKRIKAFAEGAALWLIQTGPKLWHGFLNGVESAWDSVVSFFKALPRNVVAFFKDAGKWLAHVGTDIWHGLINGLHSAWNAVTSAVMGFIHGFINGFKKGLGIASPSTVFHSIGRDIFNGLLNGLRAVWGTVNSFFGGIPGKVLGFFRNAYGLLGAAGKNIMIGLYNGLVAMWGKVQNFVGGIGSWISAHKGPVEYDRQLLVPHGKAIMDGLHEGLVRQNAAVQAFVQSVPAQITAHLNGAASDATSAGQKYAQSMAAGIQSSQHLAVAAARNMAVAMQAAHAGAAGLTVQAGGTLGAGAGGYAGGLAAGTGGGAGSTVINLHTTVQGHVWTTKDLVTELQTQLTRVGLRNTTNGTNYLGFNRGSTAAVGH